MSTPISAINDVAARSLMPGMVISRANSLRVIRLADGYHLLMALVLVILRECQFLPELAHRILLRFGDYPRQ